MEKDLELWEYNCRDCCVTFEVDEVQQKAIDAMGVRYAHDFQQSLFHPVLQTMIWGIRIDTDRQKALIKQLKAAKEENENFIEQAIGHPLNINSPKQVAELFYVELGQKVYRSKATNSPTTNDEALGKIALAEPLCAPLVEAIKNLRSIKVFLSTFLGERNQKYKKGFLDIDGRMRGSFNIAGTTTYRFSSSENAFGTGINLENIPKGD